MRMQYDEIGLAVETKRWDFTIFINPDNDELDELFSNAVFDIKLWRCRLVLFDKRRVSKTVTA